MSAVQRLLPVTFGRRDHILDTIAVIALPSQSRS